MKTKTPDALASIRRYRLSLKGIAWKPTVYHINNSDPGHTHLKQQEKYENNFHQSIDEKEKKKLIALHRPKLCENCAFPQNLHTRKLGEITAFYAVLQMETMVIGKSKYQMYIRFSFYLQIKAAKATEEAIFSFWPFL